MSNWIPGLAGLGLIVFTAALALLFHRVHVPGYLAGAGRAAEDIRRYMLNEIGEGHPHAIAALTCAVGIAYHHSYTYMAEITGLPRPLPQGEGRHRAKASC